MSRPIGTPSPDAILYSAARTQNHVSFFEITVCYKCTHRWMVILRMYCMPAPQAPKFLRFESTKCIPAIGNHRLGLSIFQIFAAARRLSIANGTPLSEKWKSLDFFRNRYLFFVWRDPPPLPPILTTPIKIPAFNKI